MPMASVSRWVRFIHGEIELLPERRRKKNEETEAYIPFPLSVCHNALCDAPPLPPPRACPLAVMDRAGERPSLAVEVEPWKPQPVNRSTEFREAGTHEGSGIWDYASSARPARVADFFLI